MNKLTASEIADFFLDFAKEHGDYLSHLKIQKLVFYADAWYMVNNDGEPLIEDEFEAWVHGPVVRSLYSRFRNFGWQPILETVKKPDLTAQQENHLIEVYDVFGSLSAYELEQMTHNEKPWLSARGNLSPDESCNTIIDKSIMYSFYKEVSEE